MAEVERINLAEFYKRFAVNAARKKLYRKFVAELAMLRRQSEEIRIVVFGSYVTDKETPGDIDVLASIIVDDDNFLDLVQNGVRQRFPDAVDFHMHRASRFLKTGEKLVENFNEFSLNREKGIRIETGGAVEIVDAGLVKLRNRDGEPVPPAPPSDIDGPA